MAKSACGRIREEYNILENFEEEKNYFNRCAFSHNLIAVMGPSGSGKTTFLGAISGRLPEKQGLLKINDRIITNDEIKNVSGYVQQADIFTETLTVYEHMRMMAALKLHSETNQKQLEKINQFIIEVNLDTNKNTLIKYLSGGQRRILSFAAEFLNEPIILFCDEPTTGLDSFSAINIVEKLKETTLNGKLIIVTIHQPSSELFNYFDGIILLANGKLVFQGSNDEALSYFDKFNLHCPNTYNPADFYIDCMNPTTAKGNELINKMAQSFQPKLVGNTTGQPIRLIDKSSKKCNKLHELFWLTWRNFIDTKRNTHRMIIFLVFVIMGLVIASLYTTVTLDSPNNVQNIQGALLILVTELIFGSMYLVMNVFPGELEVFLKEKTLYSSLNYLISKIIILIPVCLVYSFIYLTIFYSTLKIFDGYGTYFSMLYILFCTSVASASIGTPLSSFWKCNASWFPGLAFSALCDSVQYTETILTPLQLVVMIMSGIWIRLDSISVYISWLRYISPFYLSFEVMSNVYWYNAKDVCKLNQTCHINPEQVLEKYGFNENYNVYLFNIILIHIMFVFYTFLGFLGLMKKKFYHHVY